MWSDHFWRFLLAFCLASSLRKEFLVFLRVVLLFFPTDLRVEIPLANYRTANAPPNRNTSKKYATPTSEKFLRQEVKKYPHLERSKGHTPKGQRENIRKVKKFREFSGVFSGCFQRVFGYFRLFFKVRFGPFQLIMHKKDNPKVRFLGVTSTVSLSATGEA